MTIPTEWALSVYCAFLDMGSMAPTSTLIFAPLNTHTHTFPAFPVNLSYLLPPPVPHFPFKKPDKRKNKKTLHNLEKKSLNLNRNMEPPVFQKNHLTMFRNYKFSAEFTSKIPRPRNQRSWRWYKWDLNQVKSMPTSSLIINIFFRDCYTFHLKIHKWTLEIWEGLTNFHAHKNIYIYIYRCCIPTWQSTCIICYICMYLYVFVPLKYWSPPSFFKTGVLQSWVTTKNPFWSPNFLQEGTDLFCSRKRIVVANPWHKRD